MGESARMVDEARALLLSLIYPKSEERMTEEEKEAFGEAVLLEEAYLTKRKASGERAVKSESVGDVSVTYDVSGEASGKAPPVRIPVADSAYALLRTSGLLSAWV